MQLGTLLQQQPSLLCRTTAKHSFRSGSKHPRQSLTVRGVQHLCRAEKAPQGGSSNEKEAPKAAPRYIDDDDDDDEDYKEEIINPMLPKNDDRSKQEEEFEELIKRALDGGLTKEEKWGDIEEEIEGPKKVEEHGLEDLGIAFWGDLTEAQTEYKAKLAQKLEERKEEERRRIDEVNKEFALGKKAYARGHYKAAVQYLEVSSNKETHMSKLGGEIRIWLALAYDAANRNEDCIDMYKFLEKESPLFSIKDRAANLRRIAQAPKLKRGEDEIIRIPEMPAPDIRRSDRRGGRIKKRRVGTATNFVIEEEKKPVDVDGSDWKDRSVRWAALLTAIGTAIYVNWEYAHRG